MRRISTFYCGAQRQRLHCSIPPERVLNSSGRGAQSRTEYSIAEINGYSHRLKKWKASASEQQDEALAQEISEQHQERLSPFTFSKCGITIGEQIEFYCQGNENSGILCEVVDDKHVKYNDDHWSLTALAKHLTGVKGAIAGPRYFKYKGEWLNTIRERLGV